MGDTVHVRGLVLPTRVGVTDEERRREQDVVIDLCMNGDLRRAGESDDLADTVDYSSVTSKVAELVQRGEFRLLEHLAARVAGLLLQMDGIDRVTVEVGKRHPPVPETVSEITVRIERP